MLTTQQLILSYQKLSYIKIVQLGWFIGRLFGPFLKTGLPLMKYVIKPLAERVLIPLGWKAATLAGDAGIHKKLLGSVTTILFISNDEMEGIMKIVQSLENSGLLSKGVSETIQNESKEQKVGFRSMLLCTLDVY